MCEWKKHGDTRIDPCMKHLITHLNQLGVSTKACCCGHGKYNASLVVDVNGLTFDLFSNQEIPRKVRFYIRDDEGIYYIPESTLYWFHKKTKQWEQDKK